MSTERPSSGLRRELGRIESYATLLGMLVGAGIFRVTGDAWAATGPSVLLGHVVLTAAILATSFAYSAFLSTRTLGETPGGEYSHLAHAFGNGPVAGMLAYLGAWLKVISYCGALAYLATALVHYLLPLLRWEAGEPTVRALAVGVLATFLIVHLCGVRSFGRLQVRMCLLLGLSLLVLIVPGLFHVELANLRPFFRDGGSGFAASLFPLFFAWAGFESLAQTAGEVKDSRRHLPRVFARGLLATGAIYLAMSVVAIGVLPDQQLAQSQAPMADVASAFLPRGAIELVTIGGILAIATSINATFLIPSRLAYVVSRDGRAPAFLGRLHATRGVPMIGLLATFGLSATLVVTGKMGLALNVAVMALVLLYGLHSLALLLLPRLRPELMDEVDLPVSRRLLAIAATVSVASMLALLIVQWVADAPNVLRFPLEDRDPAGEWTSTELLLAWALAGVPLYLLGRQRRSPQEPRGATD